nr:MAG TPA: neurotoxin [Caudoviricetes sp.]
MALSSKFNQTNLLGGGSTPTWKRLGYLSQADYINAITGADGKKKIPTMLEEAYGSSSAIQIPLKDRLGSFDDSVVQKVWGGAGGGVTDEGVVVGNPNVEKFPTIKNDSGGKTSNETLAAMKETNVVASGGGSVPAGNGGTSTGSGGGASAGTGGSSGGSTGGTTATGGNEFGAKYQGNDFLEWYRANYGADFDPSQGFSRGQGMSDVDWAIGSNLYNSYLTGQNLDNSYNSSKGEVESNYAAQSEALKNIYEQSVSRLDELYQAEIEKLQQNYGMSVESLDTSKRNSQQAASITLDKLKKYLPTQIKAQGLGGLGVSESSMLQAYNNYNNTMGEIEGDYNANRASLDASYNDSKSSLDTTRSTGVADASLEYQKNQSALDTNKNSALSELERAYLENKTNLGVAAGEQSQNIFDRYLSDYKAEQSELYNQALYALESSGYSTEEELTSFLNQYRGVLNNENLQTLEQTAKGIVAQNAEQKRLEAEQKAEADRQQAYQAIVTNIDYMLVDPSNFNDNGVLTEEGKNRMLQYIESNRAALGDQTYNAYKSQIESMKVYTEADKQKEEAEAQAEKDKRIITGQETFEYNGKYYKIKSRLEDNANEIAHNDDFKKQISEMGYSGAFDEKIPNGTTLTVKSDAYGSNEHNWKDWVGGADITDWRNWVPFYNIYNQINTWANLETRTLTYYNGDWYLSEEV